MPGWSEHNIKLGEVELHLRRGGSGRPVVVLHHDIGTPDQLPFYDALADKFDVIVPNIWAYLVTPTILNSPDPNM